MFSMGSLQNRVKSKCTPVPNPNIRISSDESDSNDRWETWYTPHDESKEWERSQYVPPGSTPQHSMKQPQRKNVPSLYEDIKSFVTSTGRTIDILKETAKRFGLVITQTSRTGRGFQDRIGFSFNKQDRQLINDSSMPGVVFKFAGSRDGFFRAGESHIMLLRHVVINRCCVCWTVDLFRFNVLQSR
jgi:hypothetical protein